MNHRELTEELKRIILPILKEENIEFVELNFIRVKDKLIIRLLVDKKYGGINLEECARLNEKIGSLLDYQDMIKNRYILEVSSPGLDRPLVTNNDFSRCINKEVKFFLSESIAGARELEGKIIKAENDIVYIDRQGQFLQIPMSKIKSAKQIINNI